MKLISIDPGSTHSAWVLMQNGDDLLDSGYEPNDELAADLVGLPVDHLAIETLHVRGQPTSQDELDTQLWAGQFIARWGGEFTKVRRERVKGHFGASGCSNPDKIIRESLIGRFGGEAVAIGGRRCPKCNGKGWRGRDHAKCGACCDGLLSPRGAFFDWTGSDRWSALAIACWFFDTQVLAGAPQ